MWDGDGPVYRMHDGSGAGWIVMLVLMGLAAIALVVLVLMALDVGGRTHRPATAGSDAHRLLRRRFAAGDIDEDEFRRRSAALSDDTEGRS